jgi:hypothetical protein
LIACLGACDPCFGVGSCGEQPRLAIEGTFVEHFVGNPASGVRVDVVRTGGVELATDSVSAATGADGHWQVALGARAAGDVVVDINVSPPGLPSYRVVDMHITTTDHHGAGHILPTWVVNPHFAYAAEVYYRTSEDVRVGGAVVEFHRTGGISYYMSTVNQVFSGRTDAAGRLALFDVNAHAIGLGVLIGDLVVHLPPPFKPDTAHAVGLSPTQLLQAPTQIIRVGVDRLPLSSSEFHEATQQSSRAVSLRHPPGYGVQYDGGARPPAIAWKQKYPCR